MRRPRSRSQEDLDAVDVLLVEDDDEDVAADEVWTVLHELAVEAMARRATWAADLRALPDVEPGVPVVDPSPPGPVRRAARRYRRRAVTCAALVVTVAVTTAVVDVRRTAARAAALAATPAVLAQVTAPPGEVWRMPGRLVGDGDDTLLVVDGTALRAVDPATGEVSWTAAGAAARAASTGRCFTLDEGPRPDAPARDRVGPPGLLACASDPSGSATGGATDGAQVVVIDPATGRTRHTVTPEGTPLLVEPVGRDLLVAVARPDGRVRVTRWDPGARAPAWDTASPLPVLAGGGADRVERRPGSLVVGTFAVDLATGDALDAGVVDREPHPVEEHALPGGARATWGWREDGTSGRGRVVGGTTRTLFVLPGPPLRPPVTDGSDGGVLVVRTARGDRVRGLDLRTGRMRWSEPYPGASALRATALVDGVLLLDDRVTVTAVETRTGEGLWRARVDTGATDGAVLTDGRVVLLPVRADDGALHLLARGIKDGEVLWRTPLPAGTVRVAVVDHHLVAATGQEVVGLA